MPTFAVMNGNTVANIIVTEDKKQGEKDLNATLVEYTAENPAGIGWTYDATTGTFTPPVVAESTEPA